MLEINKIHNMDCLSGLKQLANESIDCVVTSPPYFGLRDYGVDGQIGLEETPAQFVGKLLEIFTEVWRVLKPEGTVWVNLGDTYAGSGLGGGGKQETNIGSTSLKGRGPKNYGFKPKDLMGIPWRFAFAMQDAGWWLRQDIIWSKPNPMPESVQDRCTRSHEYIFMFTKSAKYHYNAEAIRTPAAESSVSRMAQNIDNQVGSTRANGGNKTNGNMKTVGNPESVNRKSVWNISVKGFKEAHFATFPQELPTLCIKAGCPVNGIVLDPFMGAGTTAVVAKGLGRDYIGFELNPEYVSIATKRLYNELGFIALI